MLAYHSAEGCVSIISVGVDTNRVDLCTGICSWSSAVLTTPSLRENQQTLMPIVTVHHDGQESGLLPKMNML